jgi:hypothetical protein
VLSKLHMLKLNAITTLLRLRKQRKQNAGEQQQQKKKNAGKQQQQKK